MVIDTWENGQYKEIWVYSEETDDDERAMCGLINGDWGWLNYYNEECDAGLSSRNPNYTGTDDETMNFIINGELDPFPLFYAGTAAEGISIFSPITVVWEESYKLMCLFIK